MASLGTATCISKDIYSNIIPATAFLFTSDLRLLAQGDALLGRLAKQNSDQPNGLKLTFSSQV